MGISFKEERRLVGPDVFPIQEDQQHYGDHIWIWEGVGGMSRRMVPQQ